MVAHAFKPSNWEEKVGDFWVQSQPGLQRELQDSQGYTEKPVSKNSKKKKKKKKKKFKKKKKKERKKKRKKQKKK